MNPGSFNFGPTWWAVFIGIVALLVVATMCLFLWQASKERKPRTAPAPVAHRPVLEPGSEARPHALG